MNDSSRQFKPGAIIRRSLGWAILLSLLVPAMAKNRLWQIRVDSGLLFTSAADFNHLIRYQGQVHELQYDRFLDYLKSINKIQSWSREGDTWPERLGPGWPITLGIHFQPSSSRFSFSLSITRLDVSRNTNLEFQYNRVINAANAQQESLSYAPASLSATAWTPKMALHWSLPLGPRLFLESSLAAGPLLASCRYRQEWEYVWDFIYTSQGQSNPYTLFRTMGGSEMKGRGIGLDVSAEIRLLRLISERAGICIGVSYGHRRVSHISGSGQETRDGIVRQWEGSWKMMAATCTTPWGAVEMEIPTNEWPRLDGAQPVRGFILDLSGFSLQGGIFLRF